MSESKGSIVVPVSNVSVNSNLQHRLQLERSLFMSATRNIHAASMQTVENVLLADTGQLGRHLFADFIISDLVKKQLLNCDIENFADIAYVAAQLAKATIIKKLSLQHTVDGRMMALIVIEESHIGLQFLPEKNFIAMDVFTCGEIDFQAAVNYILKCLNIKKPQAQIELRRGIYKTDSREFLPGIAEKSLLLKKTDAQRLSFFNNKPPTSAQIESVGQHVIAEFYLANPSKLNDADWVKEVFADALRAGGGSPEKDFLHQFTPQGISAVIVSDGDGNGYTNITMHNWPEWQLEGYGAYAAIDICDFSQKVDVNAVLSHLQIHFGAEKVVTRTFLRGAHEVINAKEIFTSCISEAPQAPLFTKENRLIACR